MPYGVEDALKEQERLNAQAEEHFRRASKLEGSVGDGFGVFIVGYPGAGKTTAAKEMKAALDDDGKFEEQVVHVELDEEAKQLAPDGVKPRDDPEVFASAVAGKYGLDDADAAVLDGIESMEEIEQFTPYFGWSAIVFIRTHNVARHHRLIEDERKKDEPEMDSVSRIALRQLDKNAASSGLSKIEATLFFDMELSNETVGEDEFRSYARYAARSLYYDYRASKK